MKRLLGQLAAVASSAFAWFLLCGLVGLSQLVVGVHVLFGLGWGLVASGLACLVAASFIQRGLSRG